MKTTYPINAQQYHQHLSPLGLISSFGEKLPRLLACVLLPDGKSPQEVELDGLEKELFEVSLDQAMEVIADFLSMTDLGSLLEKVAKMIAGALPPQTGPKQSASPSPEVVH
ncbi:MAG: hypothetical protein NT087_03230 [Deltaproteobacteria bacterium]|nr:hypothetical protein [Deltaproteobacteria bacterium]